MFFKGGVLKGQSHFALFISNPALSLIKTVFQIMNYPAAELRGIKMNFYLINPDAEHRGILLIEC